MPACETFQIEVIYNSPFYEPHPEEWHFQASSQAQNSQFINYIYSHLSTSWKSKKLKLFKLDS